MQKFPVYIVNLPAANERRENAIRQFAELDMHVDVVTACNGRDPDFPFHEYKHLISVDIDPDRPFSPTTFACYLSHARCWEKLLASDDPYALVVEDDMSLNVAALERLDLQACDKSFDFIYVNSRTHRWTDRCAMMKYANRVKFESRGWKISYLHRRARNLYYRLLQRVVPRERIYRDKPFIRVSDVLLDRIQNGYFKHQVREGAKKLLSIMRDRKIDSSAVDFSMQFHSISLEHLNRLSSLCEKKIPPILHRFLTKEIGHQSIELKSYIYIDGPIVYLSNLSSESSIAGVAVFSFGERFETSLIESIRDSTGR